MMTDDQLSAKLSSRFNQGLLQLLPVLGLLGNDLAAFLKFKLTRIIIVKSNTMIIRF